MSSKFNIVVPYRADATGNRATNAQAVLSWLTEMDLNVILAEHSATPDQSLIPPSGVERIHVRSEEAFNKSAACNRGFQIVDADVVAFVDADMVMNAGILPPPRRRPRDDRRGTETIPACGGLVMMQSERYLRAGGMDDRFFGWGGEDDALSVALARIDSTMLVLKDEPAFHLWHPRQPEDRFGHSRYDSNLELARWWHSAPATDIDAHVGSARKLLTSRRHTLTRNIGAPIRDR